MTSALSSSARIGLGALRTNPLRTLLSTLGVVMGTAALVSVLSLGDGMEGYVRAQVDRTSTLQFVQIRPKTTMQMDGQIFPRTEVRTFTAADLHAMAGALTVSGQVALMTRGSALARRGAGSSRGVEVLAVTPAIAGFQGMHVAAGRMFTDAEAVAGAPVAVLTHDLARVLAGTVPPATLVDSTIMLQGHARRVIGVLAASDDSTQMVALVPLADAADAMAPSAVPRVPTMLVHVDSVDQVPRAQRDAERWLSAGDTAWKRDVEVSTNQYRVDQVRQGLLVFKLLMGALTGISLIVGGIGIMNVLLASVAERTREIGVRRATGARKREIMAQFLAESVAISGVGAVVGLGLGVAAAYAVTAVMRARTAAAVYAGLSVGTVVIAALAAVSVGVGFGLYPAVKAARLSPIDAIRHE